MSINVNIERLPDGSSQLSGTAVYNPETGVVTVQLSSLVKRYELNEVLCMDYIANRRYVMDAAELARVFEVDNSSLPTCTCFVPSQSHITQEGAEQIVNWPFFKGKSSAQCSNDDLRGHHKFVACQFVNSQNECAKYQPEIWESIMTAYVDDRIVVQVERIFQTHRIPTYRINVNGVYTNFSTHAEVMDKFRIETDDIRNSGDEVTVISGIGPSARYLETVLA